MRKEDWVIKYITGANHSGMYLGVSDIYTLFFLYEQRLLTVRQLHTFYNHYHEQPINYNALINRLNKMVKLRFIKKANYYLKKRHGFEMSMYSIGDKGLYILEYAGFITNRKENPHVGRRQYEHTLGVKEVVIRTIDLEIKRKGWFCSQNGENLYVFKKLINEYGISNVSPFSRWSSIPKFIYESEEWGENENMERGARDERMYGKDDVLYSMQPFPMFKDIKDDDDNLKPDWIFRFNKHQLSIEVDTGSERNPVIVSKIKKYIRLAKLMPTIQHHVIFAIIDNSYPTISEHGSRKQRTSNLKELIREIPELATSNLQVYVTPMRRIPAVMYQVLNNARNTMNNNIDYYKQLIPRLNNSLAFSYNTNLIESKELLKDHGFYHQGFLTTNLPVYHFQKKVTQNAVGLLEFRAIVTKMIEGNVNSYKTLAELSQLLAKNNSHEGKWVFPRDTKIIAIYPNELPETESSVLHDIFHSSISDNVILVREEDIKSFNPQFYDIRQRELKQFEDFFYQ
ncbi:replication-relaxation family protein [Bacillus paramycoides]|uniref:replication-relaxation family protein n=1 Tax=Bacillus paramycoides TaxID=2026194 RepID=UPI00405906F2